MGEHKIRMRDGGGTLSVANRSRREQLKTAKVHLILQGEPQANDRAFKLTPCIAEKDPGWDEVIREGYDDNGSPLGPVYWRVVKRNEQTLYLSTFLAEREEVIQGWGFGALRYCDPVTGTAVARIEGNCSCYDDPLQRPLTNGSEIVVLTEDEAEAADHLAIARGSSRN
jgi:hypothetical protein